MADKILHKRSSTTGSIPTTSSLELGELALNTADGKIFLKKSGSAGESVQSAVTTDSITYGTVTLSGSLVLTGSSQPLVDTNLLDVTADEINFDFDTFDLTGSFNVSGSTVMSGSLSVTGGITGSLFGTASFSSTASYVNPLTQSVSISGSILVGENSSSLYTSRTTTLNSGSTTLYSIPTSSYDAVYFDYVIKSGSNARAGQVFSTYILTSSTYIDNSTSDIGNTSIFYFSSSISSSNLVLHGTTITDGWTVKTIVRGL